MAPRGRAARWSECAWAADSGSPRNPWVWWGGEHRSTRIQAIRRRGAQKARGKGPPRSGDATGRIRGPREACFVGSIDVRDPATLHQQPPSAASQPTAGEWGPIRNRQSSIHLWPGVIRVLVADDQAAVREGVRYLLEQQPDIAVVAEVIDGEEAVRLAAELKPDVVIIEPQMAGGGGGQAVRQIMRQVPPPGVIVLSAHPDEEVLVAARAGALSYLAKDAEPEELLRGVRAAAQGLSLLDARFAEASEQTRRHEHLTARELDVLTRIAHGQSNREIAADLGLGEETVKTHVSNVLAKLGVSDRTQAAVHALRSGLVPLDPPPAC